MPPMRETMRSLVVPVYLPMGLWGLSTGILIPALPLYLDEVGMTLGSASIVLASIGVGTSLGSIPAGGATARFGERTTLFGSLIVVAMATALVGFTNVVALLVGLRIVSGVAGAGVRLSRQTFAARRIEPAQRGRAMAVVGGAFRAALLVGPLLGGVLVDLAGFRAAFIVAATAAVAGLVPSWWSDRSGLELLPEVGRHAGSELGLAAGLGRHWRKLLAGGMVPLLVSSVREGRFVVMPLIANGLGLSATEVGMLVAVSTGADLTLCPLAGWLMDRFGRLRAMVPAFAVMTVGLFLLAGAGSTTAVVVAGTVIGIGNGMASGTMLTLGADLAPADASAPFLAGLGLMQGAGRVLGPLIVGAVGHAWGLAAAAAALAVVLIVAIGWLVGVVGETGDHTPIRVAASG